LGVLVGGPDSRYGGRAALDRAELSVESLAEALGPQLNPPRGEGPQGVRIGHQDVHGPPPEPMVQDVNGCEERGRIVPEARLRARLRHLARALEHGGGVEAQEPYGDQPDGAEHAEAP